MRIDNTLGTYEEVFSQASKQVRAIADELNTYILEFDRDVCIVPRAGEKSVSYGIGSKKMSESYCYIMPHGDYVNLGFPHGALLADPDSLLEGTGKKYRHVKIHTLEQTTNEAIRKLIEESRSDRMRVKPTLNVTT